MHTIIKSHLFVTDQEMARRPTKQQDPTHVKHISPSRIVITAVCIAVCCAWSLVACADVRTPAPDSDTLFIYVSPEGDNANTGTAPDQAVASIQVGLDRLRDAHADWLLLERGHTYTAEALARLPDGRSAEHPALIGAYGEGDTPALDISAALDEFSLRNRRAHQFHVCHIDLVYWPLADPPASILWANDTPTVLSALDHRQGSRIQDIINHGIGMTNIVFGTSGDFFKESYAAVVMQPRTRLSALDTDDGVTIRGWHVEIHDADDAGLEHLRVRVGDDNVKDVYDDQGNLVRAGNGDRSQLGNGADCIQVFRSPGTQLSHLSLFWAMDEGVSVAESPGTTVSRCIIAECLSHAYHNGNPGVDRTQIYEHSRALYVLGWDVPNGYLADNYEPVVVRDCLLANNTGRSPAWSDSLPALTGGGKTLLNFAFVNNVIHNSVLFLHRPTPFTGISPKVRMDFVGNVYILGPNSPSDFQPAHWVNLINTVNNPNGSVYVENNWVIDQEGVAHDLLDWMDARDLPWAEHPHFTYETPLLTDPDRIINTVLTYAGDYTHRDEHDWRVINDARNGTGGIIDSQTEVTGP